MTRLLLVIAAAAALSLEQTSTVADRTAQVDAVFARWTNATPGCAVGVGVDGRPALQRAYGMADLEHDVPNGADTIFEAGIGLEAVHRRGGAAAGARGQAVAGRSGAQVHP